MSAVSWGIGLTAVVATAVGVNIAMTPAPATPERAAQPRVAPSTSLVVPVPQPQLLVVQAAPPQPPPAPEPPPPPPPRAVTPYLDAACVMPADPVVGCLSDHGFPAISADGTTIVEQIYPGDGGRGNPAMEIRFLDAATRKVTSTVTILDPNEYVAGDEPGAGALRAKLKERAATVQRRLDAGAFRSFHRISSEMNIGTAVAKGMTSELAGDRARLIDTEANVVLWERRFDVAVAFPNRHFDPDTDSCEPTHTSVVELAWDPPTRTLLATVNYGAGPCYCDDTIVEYVEHVR